MSSVEVGLPVLTIGFFLVSRESIWDREGGERAVCGLDGRHLDYYNEDDFENACGMWKF